MFYQQIIEQLTSAIQRIERAIGLKKDTIIDGTILGHINEIPYPICEKITLTENTFTTTHTPIFIGAWCVNDTIEVSVDGQYSYTINNIQYSNGKWFIDSNLDHTNHQITITYYYYRVM